MGSILDLLIRRRKAGASANRDGGMVQYRDGRCGAFLDLPEGVKIEGISLPAGNAAARRLRFTIPEADAEAFRNAVRSLAADTERKVTT